MCTFFAPKSKKTKSSGRSKGRTGGTGSLLPSAPGEHSLTLSRPLRLPEIRMKLTQSSTVDFTAAATLVQLRNPSGATNWSKPASMYDEFKVVGMRVRVFFPKYISIGDAGGSLPAGVVTDFPTSIVACYDNDSIAGTSYAVTAGYDKPFFAYPDGEVSFAITSLPTSSIAGSTVAGGSLATAEWCDCAFPNNMYGCIIAYINRNYAGTWGVAPGLYTGIWYTMEWDCAFRGRNTA